MRIIILILSFCLILSGRNLIGQNLVPNPSFEKLKKCPTSEDLNNTYDWFEQCYPSSMAFVLAKCNANTPLSLYTTPKSWFGFQYPHTGDNYIYIATYSHLLTRHYPQVKLKKSLDKKKYYIRLHISLSDYSSFAISNIGVHFSMDTIKGKSWELVELNPTYENPPDNILRDSVNWMVINGTYDAAGGEQFMTIGNFRSNENTNVDTLVDYAGYAGYFIDDIAVWEEGAISYPAEAGNNRAVCTIDGDSVALGTSNYDDYFYEWTPSEGLNSTTTGRPMAKPTTTTMYYLKQKDFKFDETIDSVLVLISDRCDTIVSIENGELIIDNDVYA